VTGGAGFIGSNLSRELAKENQVTIIDDLSTGYIENIQDLINKDIIKFVEGSIIDIDVLQKIFNNVDYVFHEAAVVSVPLSIKDPIITNNVNINGTLSVLKAAMDNNVKKVVYASSCAVYGDPSRLPIKEDFSLDPLSPYALSKLACEYYCKIFNEVYNLPTVSLRYFNVYGPYQDPKSEYAAVIPIFINRCIKGESLVIYGDGGQTRDFVFVDDIVQANILAAESKVVGNFNIGGGNHISINDLAKIIMSLSKKDLKIIYQSPRSGEIMHSFADISKAREKLGFKPKFDLREGLEKTMRWFLE